HHRVRRFRRPPRLGRGCRGIRGTTAGTDRPQARASAGGGHHGYRLARRRDPRPLADRAGLGFPETGRDRLLGRRGNGGAAVIAFLVTIYTAVVLVLFKFKLVKPRPYPIVITIVAGVLIIGGVVVAWMQFAPVSPKVVTTQYVVQLVPYVKGQVKKVYAQPNQ